MSAKAERSLHICIIDCTDVETVVLFNNSRCSALFKDLKDLVFIGSNNLLNMLPLPESNKSWHGPDSEFFGELL